MNRFSAGLQCNTLVLYPEEKRSMNKECKKSAWSEWKCHKRNISQQILTYHGFMWNQSCSTCLCVYTQRFTHRGRSSDYAVWDWNIGLIGFIIFISEKGNKELNPKFWPINNSWSSCYSILQFTTEVRIFFFLIHVENKTIH